MSEKLEITFLGTGSAIPTSKKNHVGTLISYGSNNILVDCGEGIQRQFKIADINPCKLTHILISHWHGDHTLGLIGLLETLRMSEFSKTLHIYGPIGTKRNFKLFEDIYGKFKIKHEIHEISNGKIFDENSLLVETLPMNHGLPANAYSIIIKDKLRLDKNKLKKLKLPNSPILKRLQEGKDITHPITKKRIKASAVAYLEKGKKVTIIMDTSPNSNAIKLAKNSDVLISEASFIEEQRDKAIAYKHLTAKQAAVIAKRAKARKLILTHNSQRYDSNVKLVLKEAKQIFKNTTLANDFDKLYV